MIEENLLMIMEEGESEEVECKLADGGLPKDMWETYSAFANTDGGIILLGIKEEKNKFEIKGVGDTKKILKNFWDTINNPQKISINLLSNNNVQIQKVGESQVIKIRVPRASRHQRPVYINQNRFGGTFRRNYEGDYKCTDDEVERMLSDHSSESFDSKVLVNYGLEDLNMDSVKSYRERFSSRSPSHPYNGIELREFLYKIGAWGRLRDTNQEGLTVAGLLMFGDNRAITEYIPHYFLDYREKSQENDRWSNRIVSSSGIWSGNLYDFYFIIINKLTSNVDIPFRMKGLIRQDDTRVHAALREALVNSLVHADYKGKNGIIIEKSENYFRFTNPGILRIPISTALQGGCSDPRNPLLFQMFNLLGVGERAGTGLTNIQLAWKEQQWRTPELIEEYQPERTILTLHTISLLPLESLEFFRLMLGEEFEQLQQDEVLALVTAEQETQVTNSRLQVILDKSSVEINKLLNNLVNKNFLMVEGQRRGTRYVLSSIFEKSKEFKKYNEQRNFNSVNNAVNSVSNGNNSVNNAVNSVSNEDNSVNNVVNSKLSIQQKLKEASKISREKKRLEADVMEGIILDLCGIKALSLKELAELLDRNSDGIRNNYLNKLEQEGKIELTYPGTKNHPMQAYKTVK